MLTAFGYTIASTAKISIPTFFEEKKRKIFHLNSLASQSYDIIYMIKTKPLCRGLAGLLLQKDASLFPLSWLPTVKKPKVNSMQDKLELRIK